MPEISVIVPIYNTEKYLRCCIESVLSQTYKDFELLLIDDGSTDSSGVICDEYASKDDRVKVIHKSNTGVSDTRNVGLNLAKGEYIITLDSDDYWLTSDALYELINVTKNNDVDIVRGEYRNVDILGNNIQESPYVQNRVPYILRHLDSYVFLSDIIVGEYFLVLCLIRRSVLEHIRFNTKRVFLEDAEFYLEMMQQDLRCIYIPICFYAYRKHNEAITQKMHPQKFFDALEYSRLCFNLAKKNGGKKELILFLINEGIKNYLFDIKVVSEVDRTNSEYNEIIKKYNLYKLRAEVIQVASKNSIQIKYYLCFLPLKVLIYYYRMLYNTKINVKKILKFLAIKG